AATSTRRPRHAARRNRQHTTRLPALAGLVVTTLVAGCTVGSPGSGDSGKPVALTTFTVIADMAENVAGDDVDVRSITKIGAEIHGYEPTPRDIQRAQDADIILDNGLGLERWFEQFVADLDVPHAVLSDGIDPLPIEGGDEDGEPNPHAWMSPDNAQRYVDNIVTALAETAPEHRDDFRARGERYKDRIADVGSSMRDELESIPERSRVLVTCEGAFGYLTRDTGMSEQYLWPVNAETEVTPQSMRAAVTRVEDDDVPAVFCESTVNDSTMRQVAADSGAEFGGTLHVDSLTESDGVAPTYLELLQHNARTITAGLTGAPTDADE